MVSRHVESLGGTGASLQPSYDRDRTYFPLSRPLYQLSDVHFVAGVDLLCMQNPNDMWMMFPKEVLQKRRPGRAFWTSLVRGRNFASNNSKRVTNPLVPLASYSNVSNSSMGKGG
jgi:hypothetical protein